jgi:hypothetical protein
MVRDSSGAALEAAALLFKVSNNAGYWSVLSRRQLDRVRMRVGVCRRSD